MFILWCNVLLSKCLCYKKVIFCVVWAHIYKGQIVCHPGRVGDLLALLQYHLLCFSGAMIDMLCILVVSVLCIWFASIGCSSKVTCFPMVSAIALWVDGAIHWASASYSINKVHVVWVVHTNPKPFVSWEEWLFLDFCLTVAMVLVSVLVLRDSWVL